MLMFQQVAIALITPSQDHLLAMQIKERQLVRTANTLALLITYRHQGDYSEWDHNE
jgi:hypothetical protein